MNRTKFPITVISTMTLLSQSMAMTDANGKYQISVPKGDYTYTPIILMPVEVGDMEQMMEFTQTARVGGLTGRGETIASEKKISGQLFMLDKEHNEPKKVNELLPTGEGQQTKVEAKILSGNGDSVKVTVDPSGKFELEGVQIGQTYEVALNVIVEINGVKQELAGKKLRISVADEGQMVVQTELIDPYGVILDSVTKLPINNVNVTLYWADTELNRQKGRQPNQPVDLPILNGFAPNDNRNPQSTNINGQYAWMVFPEGDYYLVAEKSGYVRFDSRMEARDVAGTDSYITDGVIHVGQTIVNFDLSMAAITQDSSSSDSGGSNRVSVDQPKVQAQTFEHYHYIKGYKDGTFKPDRTITRAEVAVLMARLIRSTMPSFSIPPYKDVSGDHWAAQHIELLRREMVMFGDSKDRFRPNALITRAEMASVIARFKKLTTEDGPTYQDVNNHWAKGAITAVSRAGFMVGYPDGSFRPNKSLTRAEVVTMLNRVLGRGPLEGQEKPSWPDVPVGHWAYKDIEEASNSHKSQSDEKLGEIFDTTLEHETW